MERRLTAILSADVVGYSRLMEVDEAGTLAALKAQVVRIFKKPVSLARLGEAVEEIIRSG